MPNSKILTRYAPLALIPVLVAFLARGSCERTPYAEQPEPPRTPQTRVDVSGDLAITNVTVVDVASGTEQAGRTVVVRGDRITDVVPAGSSRVVGETRVIDGTGKFLIPGLWDM